MTKAKFTIIPITEITSKIMSQISIELALIGKDLLLK